MSVHLRDALVNEIPPGPLADSIDAAIAALDSVHALPDGIVPVPLRVSADPLALGRYRGDLTNPIEILIRGDVADPGLTLAHEVGHYIDHHVLPPAGDLASRSATFGPWRAAVVATSAALELRERALRPRVHLVQNPTTGSLGVVTDNPADAAYFLQVHELFARSYAQWVIARSGNGVLLAEVAAAAQLHYPEQWTDGDFAPVGTALDNLLAVLG
jgi:hypothetical protein